MVKSLILSLAFALLLFSFKSKTTNNDLQKKIIRSNDFDIECYVSLKKITSFDDDKIYYWFKSGEIHHSVSSIGGFALHSSYIKHYKSNQLAEQGEFDYGLKNGTWKEWYENGQIKQTIEWRKGLKSGASISYDTIGSPIEKGIYRNNKKAGTWINLKTKDTIRYKKGELFVPKAKDEKESFFKRLFKKKDDQKITDDKSEAKIKMSKPSKKVKKASEKVKEEPKKKEGFFKRLFKKKDKTQSKEKKSN